MGEHLNDVPRQSLCRDCFVDSTVSCGSRCPACGSPRRLSHAERDTLCIAHIDCDAFYAAIEKRDDPSLRDRPLIIGGGRRGVVSTACYVARTFGVRSAMPMFKALAACPDAVVVRPDMAKYARVGREVRARMLELTPLVEPLSIDEAFLDLSGTERLHGLSPALVLARFAALVEREVGISVSIGLSYCKFLAKVASDLDKPRGFAVIGRAEATAFLAPRAVGTIWGVGQAMRQRLAADGIRTIGDLQRLEEGDLLRRYGSEGGRFWRLAHGIDTRPVDPVRAAKSVSAETTFEADVSGLEKLSQILFKLSERVADRLKRQALCGASVTLKLKTAEFKILTSVRSGLPPTQLSGRIFAAARQLLAKADTNRRYRLIGVGVGDLRPESEADRGDLVDTAVVREKAVERAVDRLREKFGAGAVVRGIAFGERRR